MRALLILISLSFAITMQAADLRVAVLDFDNLAGIKSGDDLGALGNDASLAEKGALLLNQQLAGIDGLRVIDRRDFMRKLETGAGKEDSIQPSFIHAAQLLRADAVLRGTLMSISRNRRVLKATAKDGGVEFETITIRVMIQALDAIDGSVLAAAQGKESMELRQSDIERTEMGTDELLSMMENALEQAMSHLSGPLSKKIASRAKSSRVGISVHSTDDPALIEIDGVLVGSTPMESLQIYKGDHVLTVSRPNYMTITKRIVLESDATIRVPMLRTDLTVEERNEIYKGADMKVYMSNGKPDLLIQTID
jgi:hypothetical protein